jgi:hypothetical protein
MSDYRLRAIDLKTIDAHLPSLKMHAQVFNLTQLDQKVR